MKKITLGILSLFICMSMKAQFTFFDETQDGQQGDIAVGDINNDGYLDVIFNGTDNQGGVFYLKNGVMINNGNGTFTKQVADNPITPGHYGKMKFGDIDGDGDMDVIFGGTGGDGISTPVGIALNDGHGVFTLADNTKYPINNNGVIISCGFADFDNNGLLDYYYFGNGVQNCAIYFQQKDGTFTKSTASFGSYDFTDPEVTVVDINKDGYLDIFVDAWINNPQAGDVSGRFCATFINDMFGGFTRYAQPNMIHKSYGSASWSDIDGDGWPDLVLNGDGWVNSGENSDGIVRVYKNNNGTLVPKTTFSFFRQLNTGGGNVLVDWDNDGDLDIIAGGWNDTKGRQATSLFLCTDPANFTYAESPLSDTYFPGLSEDTYEVADLNNDGKTDLLMMGFNGNQGNQVGSYQKNICGFCPNNSTAAYTKPGTPTGLSANVTTGTDNVVSFSWTAPASENGKKGTSYNLSLKNKTTGKWMYNPMSIVGGATDGLHQVAGMGNVCTNTSWDIYDLPAGEYEWTVQAINGAYFGGSFAAVKTFTITGSTGVDEIGNTLHPEISCAGNELKITLDANAATTYVRIFTVNGQTVANDKFNTQFTKTLKTGAYIVEVKNESGVYKTKIIIK